MLLVDSSVWIDYFNGQANPETDYLDRARYPGKGIETGKGNWWGI